MNRAELQALLDHPNLHEISARANSDRVARFDRSTTFAVIDHLDLGSARGWCGVCGATGDAQKFATEPSQLRSHATEVHVLADRDMSLSRRLDVVDRIPAGASLVPGALGDLIGDLEPESLAAVLESAGVRVIADGVHPRVHPARGGESATRWESSWRALAARGIRGHASILYGPHHGLDSVLDQVEAVDRVQADTSVFLSAAPLIFHPESFGGVQDNLLTHGALDLKVLAAVRLGLPGVDHVRVVYNRSDLKLAHISLASGADDLGGHLFLHDRTPTEDASHNDLTVAEMGRWLQEAGFAPMIRDGEYRLSPVPSSSAS